jgi:hypothetical protein
MAVFWPEDGLSYVRQTSGSTHRSRPLSLQVVSHGAESTMILTSVLAGGEPGCSDSCD